MRFCRSIWAEALGDVLMNFSYDRAGEPIQHLHVLFVAQIMMCCLQGAAVHSCRLRDHKKTWRRAARLGSMDFFYKWSKDVASRMRLMVLIGCSRHMRDSFAQAIRLCSLGSAEDHIQLKLWRGCLATMFFSSRSPSFDAY